MFTGISPCFIMICTHILDLLSWIVSPVLERNLGVFKITLKITLKDEQIKADTGAEVSVIPYELSKEILIVKLAL